MALEDQGTSVFLVGAFNLAQRGELATSASVSLSSSTRQYSPSDACELLNLKRSSRQSVEEFKLPGITPTIEKSKEINKQTILEFIFRLQEGDFDKGIVSRVRNSEDPKLRDSLFHDRIFWLKSSQI